MEVLIHTLRGIIESEFIFMVSKQDSQTLVAMVTLIKPQWCLFVVKLVIKILSIDVADLDMTRWETN